MSNELLFVPHDAKSAIETLRKRGYDNDSIYRFACAARSWCKKDSTDWKVWKEVEKQTGTQTGASSDPAGVD